MVTEGIMQVKLRVKAAKSVQDVKDIMDAAIKRRFALYKTWLTDVKKSGIIDKNTEAIEIPQVCFQYSRTQNKDIKDFGTSEVERPDFRHLNKVSFSKRFYLFLKTLFSVVLFADPLIDPLDSSKNGISQQTLSEKLSLMRSQQTLILILVVVLGVVLGLKLIK